MADEQDAATDGAVAVVRRAPFSDNPKVGARGQRTQQRILDAALRAFGAHGYRQTSVDRITRLARCSRVSFYQYFANKEAVFRQLAGQVARQVSASTEALDPLTADEGGWRALRSWVARYAEIHARYAPVFHSLESDEELAETARQTGAETMARIRARLATTSLPPRQLDPVVSVLLECLNHTLDVGGIFRTAAPDAYPTDRVEVAVTDVLHRTLFGLRPGVNVHPPGPPVPGLDLDPAMTGLLDPEDTDAPDAPTNPAYDALVGSAREVFVARGYHDTRVDDLVAAAGVSHGAFYRYFRNKDEIARVVTARAVWAVGSAVLDLPDLASLEGPAGTASLRRWLRRYHAAHASEVAMLRVWVDASLEDPSIRTQSAPLLDWGRRRLARNLGGRGFGDSEVEALVMVALLGVFGARPRRPPEIEATARVVERGFLGQ